MLWTSDRRSSQNLAILGITLVFLLWRFARINKAKRGHNYRQGYFICRHDAAQSAYTVLDWRQHSLFSRDIAQTSHDIFGEDCIILYGVIVVIFYVFTINRIMNKKTAVNDLYKKNQWLAIMFSQLLFFYLTFLVAKSFKVSVQLWFVCIDRFRGWTK